MKDVMNYKEIKFKKDVESKLNFNFFKKNKKINLLIEN